MSKIQLMVMDVDGTLTDGKIYMGREGESHKAFNIKDGAGISLLLPKHKIIPVIITARKSSILENRCRELGIKELYQDCFNKIDALRDIVKKYDTTMTSVAYIGDDLPDIPCMEEVKKAKGVVMCPADAIPEIKVISDYISGFNAGEGAVRDSINYLIQINNNTESLFDRIQMAIEYIIDGRYGDLTEGCISDGCRFFIQGYTTKSEEECVIESHRRHIDIQYMISGSEIIKMYSLNALTGKGNYNEIIDSDYWQGGIEASSSIINPGSLMVIYNGQPHKGAIINGRACEVRKLVCKIEV